VARQQAKRFGRERSIILLVWLFSMFFSLGLVADADSSEFRGIDDPPATFRDPINKLYVDVLAIYLPVLTTMLSIAFAMKPTPAVSHLSSIPFWVALLVSSIGDAESVRRMERSPNELLAEA